MAPRRPQGDQPAPVAMAQVYSSGNAHNVLVPKNPNQNLLGAGKMQKGMAIEKPTDLKHSNQAPAIAPPPAQRTGPRWTHNATAVLAFIEDPTGEKQKEAERQRKLEERRMKRRLEGGTNAPDPFNTTAPPQSAPPSPIRAVARAEPVQRPLSGYPSISPSAANAAVLLQPKHLSYATAQQQQQQQARFNNTTPALFAPVRPMQQGVSKPVTLPLQEKGASQSMHRNAVVTQQPTATIVRDRKRRRSEAPSSRATSVASTAPPAMEDHDETVNRPRFQRLSRTIQQDPDHFDADNWIANTSSRTEGARMALGGKQSNRVQHSAQSIRPRMEHVDPNTSWKKSSKPMNEMVEASNTISETRNAWDPLSGRLEALRQRHEKKHQTMSTRTALAKEFLSTSAFEGKRGGAAVAAERQCFQASWVLIGSFKTPLNNLVEITPEAIKWVQKTPKGTFQQMSLATEIVESVTPKKTSSTVSVTGEGSESNTQTSLLQDLGGFHASSAAAEQTISVDTYVLIIRTTGKPSQVAFGFPSFGALKKAQLALQPLISSS